MVQRRKAFTTHSFTHSRLTPTLPLFLLSLLSQSPQAAVTMEESLSISAPNPKAHGWGHVTYVKEGRGGMTGGQRRG